MKSGKISNLKATLAASDSSTSAESKENDSNTLGGEVQNDPNTFGGEVQVVLEEPLSDNDQLVKAYKKGLNGRTVLMDFKFEDLSLEIKNPAKKILSGVTGMIRSGKMTAIMGPSGYLLIVLFTNMA